MIGEHQTQSLEVKNESPNDRGTDVTPGRNRCHLLGALVWMAIIFTMSAQHRVPSVGGDHALTIDWCVRQTGHLVEYMLLFFLWRGALAEDLTSVPWRSLSIAAAYGLFDEIHQAFVPGRSGNVEDVLWDAAGGFVAWWLLRRLAHRRRNLSRAPASAPNK